MRKDQKGGRLFGVYDAGKLVDACKCRPVLQFVCERRSSLYVLFCLICVHLVESSIPIEMRWQLPTMISTWLLDYFYSLSLWRERERSPTLCRERLMQIDVSEFPEVVVFAFPI